MTKERLGGLFSLVIVAGIVLFIMLSHTDEVAELYLEAVITEVNERTNNDVLQIRRAQYVCEKATNKQEVVVYRCVYVFKFQMRSSDQLKLVSIRIHHENDLRVTFHNHSNFTTFERVINDYNRDLEHQSLGAGSWRIASSSGTITENLNEVLKALSD